MAKSFSHKTLLDALRALLATAVKRHRVSLMNEATVCLESGSDRPSLSVEDELAQIRALRKSIGPQLFDPQEIDAFKREGRS